jgi:outer membrane lipoprotein SlyB
LSVCKSIAGSAFLLAVLYALSASRAVAQSSDRYDRCVAWAQQQSGYYGEAPNPKQNAPLRGAAAGAAGGALLGGITGGSAGTGAAIGAAFGAIAGGVRKQQVQSSQQNAQSNFYNNLNLCLNRPPQ